MEGPDELEAGRTRRRFKRLHVLILVIAVAVTLAALSVWRRNPRAVIRVVDAQNKPIAGATIRPYAMRPKPQGGHSAHYHWTKDRDDVPAQTVLTDEMGTAIVPYPKFVAERIETGQITIWIAHPRYISDTHDIVVSTSPPSGTPWRLRLKFVINLLKNGAAVTRADPIVLRLGHALILKSAQPLATTSRLFAQSSSKGAHEDDFWDGSTPGMLVS